MRLLLLALIAGALSACPGDPPAASGDPAAATGPTTAVDIDDPQSCAPCHGAIVEEWKESMHARAYHDSDPIYDGVRTLRVRKEGEDVAGACAVCHTPRFGGDRDSEAARVGVGCASCHAVARVKESHGGPGATRLIWTTGRKLLGPHDLVDAGPGAPHATGAAPAHMVDGQTLCLACHDSLASPGGLAMCNTGPEHSTLTDAGSCVSCHMPEERGASGAAAAGRTTHRSHRFPGPHRAWYQDDPSLLAAAVDLAVRFDADTLVVTLTNRSSHSMPTGFPGRMAFVTATGADASGQPVWQSAPNSPMADTPHAVLNKVYVGSDGKPTLAPWAEKLARDTRLEPGETREISFPGVPTEVRSVTASVKLRLLPPKLAKKLGLTGKLEDEPRVARKVTVTR